VIFSGEAETALIITSNQISTIFDTLLSNSFTRFTHIWQTSGIFFMDIMF